MAQGAVDSKLSPTPTWANPLARTWRGIVDVAAIHQRGAAHLLAGAFPNSRLRYSFHSVSSTTVLHLGHLVLAPGDAGDSRQLAHDGVVRANLRARLLQGLNDRRSMQTSSVFGLNVAPKIVAMALALEIADEPLIFSTIRRCCAWFTATTAFKIFSS